MHSQKATLSFLRFLSLVILCVLPTCGGVSQDAKVAQFVQNTLVEVLSAIILGSSDDGQSTTTACSKGGSMAITFETQTNIVGDISAIGGVEVTLAAIVDFDSCVIDACGDLVTIHGSGASMNLGDAQDYLASVGGSGTPLNFVLVADQLSSAGFISGDLSFSYRLKGVVPEGGQSIESLSIRDAETGDASTRLNYGGKIFSGDDIANLPNDC